MLALGLRGISAATLADFRTKIGIIAYNINVIYIELFFKILKCFFTSTLSSIQTFSDKMAKR